MESPGGNVPQAVVEAATTPIPLAQSAGTRLIWLAIFATIAWVLLYACRDEIGSAWRAVSGSDAASRATGVGSAQIDRAEPAFAWRLRIGRLRAGAGLGTTVVHVDDART